MKNSKYLIFLSFILSIITYIQSCKDTPLIEPNDPSGIDTTRTIVDPKIVTAKFAIVNDSCEAPCTIEFKNESLEATNYIWNFDDGSEEVSDESPMHEYESGGIFEVSLIASAQGGISDTAIRNVFISTKEDPIACFEITSISNNGFTPSTITINNCSEFATQYIWSFGDGDSSFQNNQLFHTYISAGNFEIKLIALDDLGNKDSVNKQVSIREVSTFFKYYSYDPNFADDEGWDLIQHDNGDFLVVGRAQSNSLNHGLFLVQTDSEGSEIRSDQIQWHSGFHFDDGYSLFKTQDENILIGGKNYFLKMDPSWNILHVSGGENSITYNKIIESLSGNLILAGGTYPNTGFHVTFTEPNGEKIWENFYSKRFERGGGAAFSVLELFNGEIVASGITGIAPTIGGGGVLYITKLDRLGNELGYKLIPFSFGASVASSIINTSDGGILFVASVRPGQMKSQVYVLKMDIFLNKIWEKFYGGTEDEWPWDVVELRQGGYAITGFSNSETEKGDVYLLILDSNGNLIEEKRIQELDMAFGTEYYQVGNAIIQTNDGGLAITGRSAFEINSDGGKLFLIKTDAMGNIN